MQRDEKAGSVDEGGKANNEQMGCITLRCNIRE